MDLSVTLIPRLKRKCRAISRPDANLQLIAPPASWVCFKSRFAKACNMNVALQRPTRTGANYAQALFVTAKEVRCNGVLGANLIDFLCDDEPVEANCGFNAPRFVTIRLKRVSVAFKVAGPRIYTMQVVPLS